MGKTVVFWTKEKEYGDTGRVMAALACNLGITKGKEVAAMAIPGRPSEFLQLFDVRMPEKIKSGKDNSVGFYPLLQRAVYMQPTKKMVEDCGIRTINKGPLLFPWFDYDDSELTEKIAVTMIMKVMKDMFDYVLVDACHGELRPYSELLVKNADILVVLLPQDKKKWKAYFDDSPLQGEGKRFYVIYPYMDESEYSAGWFSHHFDKDSNKVYGLPASAAFTDACVDGRVAELFLEAGKKKKRQDSAFFKSIARLSKGVNDR